MQTVPEMTEIDVNPLMVHAKGQGATALDALIVAERIAQRARRPTWKGLRAMTKELSDRVAIVTGASNGTGTRNCRSIGGRRCENRFGGAPNGDAGGRGVRNSRCGRHSPAGDDRRDARRPGRPAVQKRHTKPMGAWTSS